MLTSALCISFPFIRGSASCPACLPAPRPAPPPAAPSYVILLVNVCVCCLFGSSLLALVFGWCLPPLPFLYYYCYLFPANSFFCRFWRIFELELLCFGTRLKTVMMVLFAFLKILMNIKLQHILKIYQFTFYSD